MILRIRILLAFIFIFTSISLSQNCSWEVYVGLKNDDYPYSISAYNVGGAMWGKGCDLTDSILGTPAFSMSYSTRHNVTDVNWPNGFNNIKTLDGPTYCGATTNDFRYLAFGKIRIDFEGGEAISTKSIYIDLRDDRYASHPILGYDIWIRYDSNEDVFEVTGSSLNSGLHVLNPGDTYTIFDPSEGASTEKFQPTTPQNLTLTNESGNPRLNWSASTPSSVKYKVYRNNSYIGTTTSTTYLDGEILIGAGGSKSYKVLGESGDGNKTSPSYSNTVSTTGGFYKEGSNETIPSQFSQIESVYPNPFNPETRIRFIVDISQMTVLIIYDALGKEVSTLVNKQMSAGVHEVVWNASNVPSGIYYAKLLSGNTSDTKKIVLQK